MQSLGPKPHAPVPAHPRLNPDFLRISHDLPSQTPRLRPGSPRHAPGTIPPASGIAARPPAAVRLLTLKNPRRPMTGPCWPEIHRPRGSQNNRLAKGTGMPIILRKIRFPVNFVLYYTTKLVFKKRNLLGVNIGVSAQEQCGLRRPRRPQNLGLRRGAMQFDGLNAPWARR